MWMGKHRVCDNCECFNKPSIKWTFEQNTSEENFSWVDESEYCPIHEEWGKEFIPVYADHSHISISPYLHLMQEEEL